MSFQNVLPPGFGLRRATGTDAARFARLMRTVDRVELESLEGRAAVDILSDAITAHARVLTMDDQPIVLYGIVDCDGLPGQAAPWLATRAAIDHDGLMDIMWLSRLQVDAWQRRWPILQAVCGVSNSFSREWLEWLGFSQAGHLASFGAAGLAFDLFVRTSTQTAASYFRPADRVLH